MPTQPVSSRARPPHPAESQPGVRIIKKYPNRRLYDGEASRYITMAEVKALVMRGEPFVVRDVKTHDDLTRSVLLQIILEEEAAGAPMFSEAALRHIIRFYGNAMHGFFGKQLEANAQAFFDFQSKLTDGANPMPNEAWAHLLSPAGAMAAYAQQSQAMMEQLREQMQKHAEQMMGAFAPKRGGPVG